MAQPTANTSLSTSARLALYLGPPATVLLIGTASPKAGFLTPLAFLPAAGLYKAYSRSNSKNPTRHANLESLVWTTLISASAGVGAAVAIQTFTGYGTATALFGNGETRDYFVREVMRASVDGLSAENIASRAALAFSWQNTVFNAIFSFVGAAFAEETLKYLPVAYCRHSLKRTDGETKQRSRAALDYALAWGLGIGLVEAIGGFYGDRQSPWSKIALTVFERLVLGSSAHLVTAALSSLRSIRLDQLSTKSISNRSLLDFFSIIGPSMFLHGANNFGLFSFSAWNGNIGFIHPTSVGQNVAALTMYCTALGTAGWLVRREWKAIHESERKEN